MRGREQRTLINDMMISKEKVSGKKRLKLLYDVEHYLKEHITEPLTVSKLAFYFKVSERTLLYAFKNRFDWRIKYMIYTDPFCGSFTIWAYMYIGFIF